ncbi:MAG TPA: MOSC N-terminal beta barrel domain-containing protein [Planctomycetota bacterium]|nr:MOSC N-terminal beta barrel domain-containing protein [Planctomycetota bacterium]
MVLAELWRYPVKSMGGEPLREAEVGLDGLHGDRIVHVVDPRGRVVTARSKPALLARRASLGPDGEPLVDGRPWTAVELEAAAGPGARLMRSKAGLFDILPLLVATDGAVAAFGRDGRRLRPNLVIGGVDGLAERGWEGHTLRIGDVAIELVDLRERCVMTTFDPDTQAQDVGVLLDIRRRFGGTLALNARVVAPGRLRVGDAVVLEKR